jgi:hypothetical protein
MGKVKKKETLKEKSEKLRSDILGIPIGESLVIKSSRTSINVVRSTVTQVKGNSKYTVCEKDQVNQCTVTRLS